MKRKLQWILPGMLILVTDRVIKVLTADMYKVLIPDILAIHSTKNTGAAMGILSGNPVIILIISLLLIIISIWMIKGMRLSGLVPIALSLLAGGALGNIIDRIAYGHVLDMFKVLFMDFYIFNMADVGVVCGAALCSFSLLFRSQDWSKR